MKLLIRDYIFHSPEKTARFAQTLSLWAKPGHSILLQGDLGSGKSTFARAFIKSLAIISDEFEVPSPSFSLVQSYDNTRIPIAHVDLYRLTGAQQVLELGLAELLTNHMMLVEWPELLLPDFDGPKLQLTFSGEGQTRHVTLKADGAWTDLILRNEQIERFIATTTWHGSERRFLEGDASSRRYETVHLNGISNILMDMPQKPDGPPVQNGKPYSAIAHLAESISAVVAVNTYLRDLGYSAPAILASDLTAGLAIIENLGDQVYGRMMKSSVAMQEPMLTAVEVLADMATQHWPYDVKINERQSHEVPSYDLGAQLIEVDLLVTWFWPYVNGNQAVESLHHSFEKIWRELLPLAVAEKPQWVLRDFHSPNLIWITDRKGLQRVGLIDTQDCLMGHAAYDLASMLQDARVDIGDNWADQLYAHYVSLRTKQGAFDDENFSCAYAILGAQRATKILGIFARLAKRDGKPGYLQHMPRVSRYLARNLAHPALGKLKQWYHTHLPAALEVGHT